MKAKEYAKEYLNSEDKKETLLNIARAFLIEIVTVAKARNVKKEESIIPICNELNTKWKAFAGIVNSRHLEHNPINELGFENLVADYSDELFKLWKK